MFTAPELDEHRADAESQMLDELTAYSEEWAKIDGLDKKTWIEQDVTFGKLSGRSRGGDPNTRTVTVGGVELVVLEGGLHLPLGVVHPAAALPKIGWEYVLTWLGPLTDPALLGRRWRVVGVPAKSHATARRIDVVEV